MKRFRILLFITALLISASVSADDLHSRVDSIRIANNIPEIGYAIVSADSMFRAGVVGVQRWGSDKHRATMNDRFMIGSCTKSVTALMAAMLVQKKQISWDTKFFDLYPKLKETSRPEYADITLQQLLSHRARIQPFESGDELAKIPREIGLFDPTATVPFAQFVLTLEPVADSFQYSNAGYTLAALMLEKVSGKPWEVLVETTLYENFGISAGFSFPNIKDSLQPWCHTPESLKPLSADDVQYGAHMLPVFLAAGGNVNLTVPDFANYLQVQLRGLQGKIKTLDQQSFELMHYGLPNYSLGWYNQVNSDSTHTSFHFGNVSNICYAVMVVQKERNLATLVVANCATDQTRAALLAVSSVLTKTFRKN